MSVVKGGETYKRMCDVYKGICYSKKNVYKWAKHKMEITSLCQKDTQTQRFSGIENVLGTTVSKEGYADSLSELEGNQHNWFLWKRSIYKQCFVLPNSKAKIHLIYQMTFVYIYVYIYIVLFGPVKPKLGGIPSGQKKNIRQWTFKFSW